jgi:hypothetical protein
MTSRYRICLALSVVVFFAACSLIEDGSGVVPSSSATPGSVVETDEWSCVADGTGKWDCREPGAG